MSRPLGIALALLLLARTASAENKPLLAVLDFSQSSTSITPDEIELLSDIARETALDVAGSRYDIITRESLLDLLKSHGKTLEKCIGECETETGRLIGADVVISGKAIKAFGGLRLTLKMHQTRPPSQAAGEHQSHRQAEERHGEGGRAWPPPSWRPSSSPPADAWSGGTRQPRSRARRHRSSLTR